MSSCANACCCCLLTLLFPKDHPAHSIYHKLPVYLQPNRRRTAGPPCCLYTALMSRGVALSDITVINMRVILRQFHLHDTVNINSRHCINSTADTHFCSRKGFKIVYDNSGSQSKGQVPQSGAKDEKKTDWEFTSFVQCKQQLCRNYRISLRRPNYGQVVVG